MEKTNIIVWVNGSKFWNWVYLENGILYIKASPKKYDFAPLAEYHIDKIDKF